MRLSTALCVCLTGTLLLEGNSRAQTTGSDCAGMAMYGINRVNAQLSRYDFAGQRLTTIGTVRDGSGAALAGVDASAYIPGFQNIFGFWADAGGSNKLLYIDCESARGTIMAHDLEGGRITGAVAVGPVWQSSMHFDGENDFEEIPHDDRFLLDNGTLMFWFNAEHTDHDMGLISKDSRYYDAGGHLTFAVVSSALVVRLQSTTGSNFISASANVVPDQWYHVAFTFGGCGMKLYLDGADVGSNAYAGGLGTTSGGAGNHEPIVIGASAVCSDAGVSTALNSFFAGHLGHLQITDQVLSPTEIVAASVPKSSWCVYGVQRAQVSPPVAISGCLNINPNNSPHNEFEVFDGDQLLCSRDDLHSNTGTDNDGVFMEGHCTRVRIKPKGNNAQATLVIDGEVYPIQNSNTYIFNGDMTVRVFNDRLHNGKAMGHWWFECLSGTIILDDEVQLPNRLVQIDHKAGTVTELMALEREYDSLASANGMIFYATVGDQLYQLNTICETEALVGSVSSSDVPALEFADDTLFGFDASMDSLVQVSEAIGSGLDLISDPGVTDLGTMVFVPLANDPAQHSESYD